MSALPPKADIIRHGGNVRLVPQADILRCAHFRFAPHSDQMAETALAR
jgi:hypothetical protein